MRGRLLLSSVVAALAVAVPAQAAPRLEAGVGRADITPPTGYYMMGWVRSDAKVIGQHTRLYVRAIVLREGRRKFALLSADLNAIAGGVVEQAAAMDKDLGFSEQNVLVSASHTHAAPTGFYNFGTYNTVFMTAHSPTDFKFGDTRPDPALYTFMVRQFAVALRRANRNLGPAEVGWGATRILGLTQNRSIEAHLADHGIMVDFGKGSVAMDPFGYPETIDPDVNVLRVDKLRRGRRIPVGMWATFSDHGTVNKYTFNYYNADHHGAATRVVEAAIRRAGHVPRRQDVVGAYGNTDEGDITAGIAHSGPADADHVGRVEAAAFMRAWRRAGRRMSRRPMLDWRWNRVCFCGEQTEGGQVDSRAVVGLPLTTGSEEGRGPLFDVTHVPFEGYHQPFDAGAQGDKIRVADTSGSVPQAVPLTALRLGDRMIVSIPGEMTEAMGRRVRQSVLVATAVEGVKRVVISGLANEYLSYFTTPEEYERQHYEGGSTLYGRLASNLLMEEDTQLARLLVNGQPAPKPYPFDPTDGVKPDGPAFPRGAARGAVAGQPARVRRLGHATFRWRGGPKGEDRPLERAFVRVQRRVRGRRWRTVASDLGLQILWSVDSDGVYTAKWEVPLGARRGAYRFVIAAKRYRLRSRRFAVLPARSLTPRLVSSDGGRSVVALDYPKATENVDYTYRPRSATGGRATFLVGGHRRRVSARRGLLVVRARRGTKVTLRVGAGRDRYGNRTGRALSFTAR